jgi:hypothetical protein
MNERKSQAKFFGKRYWKVHDPSLVLIYDVHGYIAGIQTAVSVLSSRLYSRDTLCREFN